MCPLLKITKKWKLFHPNLQHYSIYPLFYQISTYLELPSAHSVLWEVPQSLGPNPSVLKATKVVFYNTGSIYSIFNILYIFWDFVLIITDRIYLLYLWKVIQLPLLVNKYTLSTVISYLLTVWEKISFSCLSELNSQRRYLVEKTAEGNVR